MHLAAKHGNHEVLRMLLSYVEERTVRAIVDDRWLTCVGLQLVCNLVLGIKPRCVIAMSLAVRLAACIDSSRLRELISALRVQCVFPADASTPLQV